MLERDRESTVVFVEGARDAYLGYVTIKVSYHRLSRDVRKPDFRLWENKGADQRLCLHYSDSTITLLPKSEISSF